MYIFLLYNFYNYAKNLKYIKIHFFKEKKKDQQNINIINRNMPSPSPPKNIKEGWRSEFYLRPA